MTCVTGALSSGVVYVRRNAGRRPLSLRRRVWTLLVSVGFGVESVRRDGLDRMVGGCRRRSGDIWGWRGSIFVYVVLFGSRHWVWVRCSWSCCTPYAGSIQIISVDCIVNIYE